MKKITYLLFLLFTISFLLTSKGSAQQSRRVVLGGFNLKPPVATSASGLLTVELKNDSLQVYGDFSHLTNQYYGAYIMAGEPGEAGNQLFRLNAELNKEKTGGVLKAEENTFALSETDKNLLQAGKLYVVIATRDHPYGEIGGQIKF